MPKTTLLSLPEAQQASISAEESLLKKPNLMLLKHLHLQQSRQLKQLLLQMFRKLILQLEKVKQNPSTNVISTHVDEVGTYCLINVEKWLGIL